MVAEVAMLNGDHCGLNAWDAQKLVDCIDLAKLCGMAVMFGYPRAVFVLSMQMHAAPRMLKLGQAAMDRLLFRI